MDADDNHERRIVPVDVVKGRRTDNRDQQRDDEGDLNRKPAKRILTTERGRPTTEPQYKLCERENDTPPINSEITPA